MKKLLLSILGTAALISCGPSQYALQVEMRYPSKSGLDLAAKSLSVIYIDDQDELVSAFNTSMAEGFAYALEQDYGMEGGTIEVYSMPRYDGADYTSRDSLINLLIGTGTDVLFLFDKPALGEMTVTSTTRVTVQTSKDSAFVSTVNLPFTMKMYCYDSMNKQDKVFAFAGTSSISPDVYTDGATNDAVIKERAGNAVGSDAFEAGKKVASSFKSEWKHEQYSILFYDNDAWYDALQKAYEYDWKAAMDIWFKLLDTNDMMKRSSAEYNIATACYMMGDYNLASEWLDRSDADNVLPLSAGLRKRIDARK